MTGSPTTDQIDWMTDNVVECCGREGCEEELGYYNPKFSAAPIMVCPDCAAALSAGDKSA